MLRLLLELSELDVLLGEFSFLSDHRVGVDNQHRLEERVLRASAIAILQHRPDIVLKIVIVTAAVVALELERALGLCALEVVEGLGAGQAAC